MSPLPASPPEGIQVCCSPQAWVLKRQTSWVPASQACAHTWCFGCLLGLLHPHQLGACVLGVGSRGQVRWGHLSCPCPFQGSEEEEGGPQPWLPWQRGGSLVSGGSWQPWGHRVSPPPAKVPGQVLPGHKASSVSLRLCSQPSWPGSWPSSRQPLPSQAALPPGIFPEGKQDEPPCLATGRVGWETLRAPLAGP